MPAKWGLVTSTQFAPSARAVLLNLDIFTLTDLGRGKGWGGNCFSSPPTGEEKLIQPPPGLPHPGGGEVPITFITPITSITN